jgi:hypothetical protein
MRSATGCRASGRSSQTQPASSRTRRGDSTQKLVGAICDRGRLYDDLATGLSSTRSPRLVRLALETARDANRMGSNLYAAAFDEYRRAGYALRPAG